MRISLMRRTAGRPVPSGKLTAKRRVMVRDRARVHRCRGTGLWVNLLAALLGLSRSRLPVLLYAAETAPISRPWSARCRSHAAADGLCRCDGLLTRRPGAFFRSCLSGSFRTSSRSRGCIATIMRAPESECCPWWSRMACPLRGRSSLCVHADSGQPVSRPSRDVRQNLPCGSVDSGLWFLYTGVRVAFDRTNVRARQRASGIGDLSADDLRSDGSGPSFPVMLTRLRFLV